MRNNRKRRTKKHCGFMDKPCLEEECKIYYSRFDRCSIELMPDNLYFHKNALADLVEITKPLVEILDSIDTRLENGKK